MKKKILILAAAFLCLAGVFFIPGARNPNQTFDQEMDSLIQEARLKQAQHPVFDPRYAITASVLKQKLLTDLAAYYCFAENHRQFEQIVSERELTKRINQAKASAGRNDFAKQNRGELKNAVLKALGIGFLFPAAETIPIDVITVSESQEKSYVLKTLRFKDRQAGDFKVAALIPRPQKGKIPAVIFFHGHAQSAEECLRYPVIREALKKQIAVFIPQFRAMGLTEEEFIISKKLLLHGFSLMGLRVYEAARVLAYLRSLEFIDRDRIGLIAHSGGSAAASLLAIVDANVKAKVIDYKTDFINITDLYGIHCETVPALAEKAQAIADQDSNYTPTLVTGYGLDDTDRVLRFLEQYLTKQ